MFYLLLGLLVILPIAEIAVIVEVGQATNWLVVVLLTILTAALGAALIRWQGLNALKEYRAAAARREVPVGAAVDGVSLLLAAPLMMTPGFITDAFGFALLIPPVRRTVARALLRRVKRGIDRGQVRIIRR
ncbi:FxsA family protein [Parvularcula oceani]|uniref:FxsA family protein n=1 Tax=Parvularcula oceani TaxID=1247963 RepID=UPI000569B781|nr:FxsA family protein [Parvularcula oceani]